MDSCLFYSLCCSINLHILYPRTQLSPELLAVSPEYVAERRWAQKFYSIVQFEVLIWCPLSSTLQNIRKISRLLVWCFNVPLKQNPDYLEKRLSYFSIMSELHFSCLISIHFWKLNLDPPYLPDASCLQRSIINGLQVARNLPKHPLLDILLSTPYDSLLPFIFDPQPLLRESSSETLVLKCAINFSICSYKT